jgi:hypothetical protein
MNCREKAQKGTKGNSNQLIFLLRILCLFAAIAFCGLEIGSYFALHAKS